MRGFSKAIVAGNVTRDPEMRTTPNGSQNCWFSIAVNRVRRDQNGNETEQTSFIDCTAWGRLAETICQYIHKGDPFLVSGRLEQHSWEDQATHQTRSRTEIIVEDFTFIPRGGGDGNYSNSSNPNPFSAANVSNNGSGGASPSSDEVPSPEEVSGEVTLDVVPF